MKTRTDETAALRERLREAQEVKIADGAIHGVMEGRTTVVEALRDSAGKVGDGEHRDASGYDPVLRWHCRF